MDTEVASASESTPAAESPAAGNQVASTPPSPSPSPSRQPADNRPVVDLDAGHVPLGTFDMPSEHAQQRKQQSPIEHAPITPPRSWSKEDREFFAQLPP